jgi:dethiobiotin synthetase
MPTLFVTATGTDLGKTFVSAGLIRAARARGVRVAALKPVASGHDPARLGETDAAALLKALGQAVTADAVAVVSPFRFALPLSPDMAARREGRTLSLDAVLRVCREAMAPGEALLIEGVGGVMVPLDGRQGVLDWVAALGCPAVVVAGSYLGTISHSLTALAVLRARAVPVLALVVSETPGSPVGLDETVAALAEQAAPCPVLAVPRGSGEAAFERLAGLWLGHQA